MFDLNLRMTRSRRNVTLYILASFPRPFPWPTPPQAREKALCTYLRWSTIVNGLNPGVSAVRIVWSSGWRWFWEELLLVTDVSTTWAEVIIRVNWIVFVRRCYMSGPLKLILFASRSLCRPSERNVANGLGPGVSVTNNTRTSNWLQ